MCHPAGCRLAYAELTYRSIQEVLTWSMYNVARSKRSGHPFITCELWHNAMLGCRLSLFWERHQEQRLSPLKHSKDTQCNPSGTSFYSGVCQGVTGSVKTLWSQICWSLDLPYRLTVMDDLKTEGRMQGFCVKRSTWDGTQMNNLVSCISQYDLGQISYARLQEPCWWFCLLSRDVQLSGRTQPGENKH